MLDLLNLNNDHLPPTSSGSLSDQQILQQLSSLKHELADKVVVLGHHYQQDDIIEFADHTGDSLELARVAAKLSKPNIIFCGVHFMAETADMLTGNASNVILPDLKAGCSMADMACLPELEKAWRFLTESSSEKFVPVTYINSSAELKAFVGRNGGSICTSTNAKKIIEWALQNGDKLVFFPDQHLGRNTCYKLGVPLEQMAVFNPHMQNGGLIKDQVVKSKVILWYGYCSVHQGFTVEQVHALKKQNPATTILVHPECRFDVVQAADLSGSTSFIINTVEKAPSGSAFAIGTEINLVNRLAKRFPDKIIHSLSPYQCLCTTMYRVRPKWLLESFLSIKRGNPVNIIRVPELIRKPALIALNRMLEIS